MTETPKFTAGKLTAVPVRVHAYESRGVFMICDEHNSGCWTDPEGRVLLPSKDLVDRVLKAHGYVRQDMAIVKASPEPGSALILDSDGPPVLVDPPTPEPEPESSPSEPTPEPPPAPEPAAEKPAPAKTTKVKRGGRRKS